MVQTLERATTASRVFCLAAIAGLAIATKDTQATIGLMLVAAIAFTAVYLSSSTLLSPLLIVSVEASLIGLVIGLALPGGVVLLPYIVVLALIAGISQGIVGVSAVTVAQIGTMGVLTARLVGVVNLGEFYQALAPWFVTSILAGFIGTWLRESGRAPRGSSPDGAYESARRLLSQLRTVSKNLDSGLDLASMANQVLDALDIHLGHVGAAVFVRSDGRSLTPLAYSNDELAEVLDRPGELGDSCWDSMDPVIAPRETNVPWCSAAFPLRVGSRMLGLVIVRLTEQPSQSHIGMLMDELDNHSVRLETAMTFDEIRTIATMEERRRLAREVHDGIAQEVASLGYMVDEMQTTAESTDQRSSLAELRRELTRVVSELRFSIFDLRSDVLAASGLGSALSEHLRQMGSKSSLTVHLSLNEAPTRLRANAEAELLRIAGEAISNVRKHSAAQNLWVNCTVQPPFACIEVRDDGVGMKPGRSDSYGLRGMRERAERLGAKLTVEPDTHTSGTHVRVTIGDPPVNSISDRRKQTVL